MRNERRHRRCIKSGHSLIEVLVALMLLSISIGGAAPIVNTAINRIELARHESLARRLLNERLVSGEVGEGSIDPDYGLVGEWRAERIVIEEGRIGSAPVRLEEIRIEVEWHIQTQTRALTLTRREIVPVSP